MLRERVVQRHAYSVIETRGPRVSLYLHWRDGLASSYYEIRSGVGGKKILELSVARGTGPWTWRRMPV